MASGWNLWVWLPCIGVVSGCCCKEVFPTPLVLALFLAAASLLVCSFLICFFVLVYVINLQYIANFIYSKNIRDRSKKSRSREYNK